GRGRGPAGPGRRRASRAAPAPTPALSSAPRSRPCGAPAGATTVERPVAQRGARDVALAVQAVRTAAGGEQSRDRRPGTVEDPRIGVGVQAAEREALRLEREPVERLRSARARRVGAERGPERPEPLGVLTALGIVADPGPRVVTAERVGQGV